jgi:hypothetical protein
MTRSESLGKLRNTLRWLPAWGWQQLSRRRAPGPSHLIIAIADHFEPSIVPSSPGRFAPRDEQERRLERWCREYPSAMDQWRDADGYPLRHTYFFPAEQYDPVLMGRLAEHCREGWGEVEIHLHHGIEAPDTPENTERALVSFRDSLEKVGCLSRWEGQGPARYAFVHGNWALANSARGRYCGVDSEMEILSRTGCYADLTLPSAPSPAQTSRINALYECSLPLSRRAPHREGRDLRVGRAPQTFPLIFQGPLGVALRGRGRWPRPGIENGELSGANPPTLGRLHSWRRAAVTVKGRPNWVFIKLHCHGMDPRAEPAMFGAPMRSFIHDLLTGSASETDTVRFVTAREMVNIALAACDGHSGEPGTFRDYRLKRAAPGKLGAELIARAGA